MTERIKQSGTGKNTKPKLWKHQKKRQYKLTQTNNTVTTTVAC